jgi:phosphoglycerate dehydrogenase-like enzyme
MKPSAFLINTARGALINDSDISVALNSGKIAGAALDVLSSEPPSKDNPLLTARNCIITPHIAWAARSTKAHHEDHRAQRQILSHWNSRQCRFLALMQGLLHPKLVCSLLLTGVLADP